MKIRARTGEQRKMLFTFMMLLSNVAGNNVTLKQNNTFNYEGLKNDRR